MSSYFGSKAASGLFQNIISIMPPHTTYIETHLGGGAVMKKKPPTANNIGIDLDVNALSNFNCDYAVQLIEGCAHRFLDNYEYTGTELIYCDPPYLLETRTSSRKYRFDYTKQDHIKLLEQLKSLPCQIILSGYPSTLYNEQLNDWNCIELQAMTRGGPRTEILWYNYTIDRTYWATYAGKNFTDRQRIKRKAQRWSKNYERLPRAERLAIMSSLMKIEGETTR
ncbi:MAG: DNA methylase [Gammaproteobacteria bacterium]